MASVTIMSPASWLARSMGLCLFHLGEFVSAREHFERVLTLYVLEAHHTLASVAAFDMRSVALSYTALELFILGYPEQADEWSEQALIWSRSLRHPHNLAFSLNYAAFLEILKGSRSSAEALLGELKRMAEEHQFPVWLLVGKHHARIRSCRARCHRVRQARIRA